VAEAALAAGADWLAVALVGEAIRLREAGVEAPILLLSEPEHSDVRRLVEWSITPTLYRPDFLTMLDEAITLGTVAAHLKVDTGMHRVGADPESAMRLAMRLVDGGSKVRLGGLWTHFAVAEEDARYTSDQIEMFGDVVERLRDLGIEVPIRHLANTAGAILHKEARGDMVRVGLGMYGLYPSDECRSIVDLAPAMRVVSHVSMVRRLPAGSRPSYGRRRPLERGSTVVTAPIGYADGLPRLLSQRDGAVLIGGSSHPFAGTVTMDQIVVDVGDLDVAIGDEVVLIGEQGEAEVTADDWAAQLDTISYEVVCSIGPRVPRRYL
jgi:alanine racemase